MKKILIALIAVALSCSAMAQTKMTPMHKMDNSCMMMHGKMMTMMNGKSMPMSQSMTMANGTMVMPNGTIKTKSGRTMKLKNGYCVMMDGKIEKMPMKKGMMKM